MNIENIRNDFPEMPENIRSMIAQTVAEQVRTAEPSKPAKRNRVRRTAILAFAAALVLGVTALAAGVMRLHSQRVGDLAVAISVEEAGSAPGAVAFSGDASEDVKFTSLDVTPGWLPEGMKLFTGETTKWSFEDNWGRGGFSLGFLPLNAGNATFCEVVTDAERQETLDINGHEAIYVQTAYGVSHMFIAYPEYNAVLTIWIGSDADFDTAKRFAENLTVTAGNWEMDAETLKYNGKRYLDAANFIATGVYVNTADEDDGPVQTREEVEAIWAERDPANRAVKNDMADAHEIGESFAVTFPEHRNGLFVGFTDLDVKVTEISVRDDYSALRDTQYLDMDWASRVDENGKLPRADYEFVVRGDGVNTPSSTVVATLPDQQLYMVAVTVEVTNSTDHTIEEAGYNGRLLSIAETADGWEVTAPQPTDASVEYDESWCTGGGRLDDMRYWDLRWDGSNGGNQITDLAPGESVTIQMGFVVSECQMGNLWFYMNEADIEGPDEIHVGYVPVP